MIHIGTDDKPDFTRAAFLSRMPFQHFREGKSRLRQSAGSRRHAYGYGQNGTVGPRKAQEGQKHFNGVFPHVTGDIRREAAAQTLQFLSQLRIHGDIAQGRPPCAFRPESLHMAHSRMRRTEHNQTPGQFHPGQGRACNRAAVHISGMRQKNHQRMACPAGKRRSLSEQSGKSGGRRSRKAAPSRMSAVISPLSASASRE